MANVVLEGAEAAAYCALGTRLLEVARAGVQFPEPAALRHALWALGQPVPRQPVPRVELRPETGWPTLRSLDRLSALRATAADYLAAHGAKPKVDSKAFLTALAATPLPVATSTVAQLVSKSRGGGRFQVVHDRYTGSNGAPVRFTFHLTDAKRRYLSAAADGQVTVTRALSAAVELSCEAGAEEALWGLASLDGAQVSEVVAGQLGPLEVPRWTPPTGGPLDAFLRSAVAPAGSAVLHLVVERAATDVTEDRARDPFAIVASGHQLERRRTGLKYRVSRERRLACTEAVEAPLQVHLAALGQPLVVRSR